MPPESLAPVKFLNLRDTVLGRFLGLVGFILLASFSVAGAASVALTWNASPSPSVAGYKVYYSTNGNSLPPVNVGKATTATISNLNDATTYLFSVTAYDSAGIESQPSNQISYTTPSSSTQKYTLTVVGGSGSGLYPAGIWVPVSANPPDPGEQFAYWDGDTSILQTPRTNANNQAFIPLRDTSITAVYSDSPDANGSYVGIDTGSSQGTGLRGDYYNNVNAAGSPVLTRTDATVDFDWSKGSPASQVISDYFSVRWTGQVKAPVSGTYTFTVTGDDGVRLFINGAQVINGWSVQSATSYTYTTTLSAGTLYNLELHYYENWGLAVCRLRWSYPGQSMQVIPRSQLYPSN